MLSKRRIEWAMYALFVVAIMVAPLIMESFWLNRVAKYLVPSNVEARVHCPSPTRSFS